MSNLSNISGILCSKARTAPVPNKREVPLIGADSVVHMSEEIQDAGRNIPRSMILTIVVNGALGQ